MRLTFLQMLSRIRRAPQRVTRVIRKRIRMRRARRLGIRYVPPNIVYRDVIGPGDIVADAGCADDADFSKHMIAEHGAVAWGIDPTRKHAAALAQLASQLAGFHYMPVAIAAESGIVTFHESDDNVSGSLLTDHVNMMHDAVQRYDVQALDLQGLASRIGSDRIAILKLDLEGAEYELLSRVTSQMLQPFDQIFIEFHHHAITRYDESDTRAVVHRLEGLGFASFSLDDHNYIFYHEPAASPARH